MLQCSILFHTIVSVKNASSQWTNTRALTRRPSSCCCCRQASLMHVTPLAPQPAKLVEVRMRPSMGSKSCTACVIAYNIWSLPISGTDWLEVPTIYKTDFRGPQVNIPTPYGLIYTYIYIYVALMYLHFWILKFPLIWSCFITSIASMPEPLDCRVLSPPF